MKYFYTILGITFYISLITFSSAMIVKYENAKQYENAKVFLSETLKKVKEESVSLLPAAVKESISTEVAAKSEPVEAKVETKVTTPAVTPKESTAKVTNSHEREEEDEDD